MKKIVLILMAAVMAFTLLGCATVKISEQPSKDTQEPAKQSEEPAEQSEEPAEQSEEPTVQETPAVTVPAADPTNPSESYAVYVEAKSAAMQRITDKIEGNSELGLSVGMSMLSVTMVDLGLIPLSVVSMEGAAPALEMFGMSGVEVSSSGNEYRLAYKDEEGNAFVMTSKYDPATDSVQTSISDGAKEQMYFEYVKTNDGYASQYYYDNGDGTYTTLTTYFNDTDTVAYGMISSASKPSSIFGNSSLTVDFVKTGESYCILEGNALTVFENGGTKTY